MIVLPALATVPRIPIDDRGRGRPLSNLAAYPVPFDLVVDNPPYDR